LTLGSKRISEDLVCTVLGDRCIGGVVVHAALIGEST
jgi:hypothetical protein